MLVLTRRDSEKIVVRLPDGRIVAITVCEIRGDKVRLGFEAAADIVIHRQEVWERTHGE